MRICIENLRKRAEFLRLIRWFFDQRQFIEIQTPILSADTVIDPYIDPISVTDSSFPAAWRGGKTYYLRTSPEFAMKRLLAAGMEAIYEIGSVFRKGDRGQFHNVEFTMLEWYRAGDNYHTGMKLLAELIRFVDKKLPKIVYDSFQNVFQEHVGINPYRAAVTECRRVADLRRVVYPDSFLNCSTAEDWVDLLFSELVQPNLRSVIVYDFPAWQSQLARIRADSDDKVVSERFELFLNGIEIANGYHELLDAEELRKRFRENLRQRLLTNRELLPVESRLLTAMESGLPACSGTALGIDRLLMVLLNAASIDEVLTFPIELS
jgi:lysyl-tRNA synthetase class 2